jgi:hypothetical protein
VLNDKGEQETPFDNLARQVSYSSWCLFIIRYYNSINELFPRNQVKTWKKDIVEIFMVKSDRNIKNKYDEYRLVKNNTDRTETQATNRERLKKFL